jgi:orotate phosphoribosyltransferase-like protein
METLLSFITPSVGALIVSITFIISIAKKIRPQIKRSKFWWHVMPYLPAIIGVCLAIMPGIIESNSIGVKIIVGIASSGIATMGRNMLKRSILDRFDEK